VDKVHQGLVDPENGVLPAVVRVVEELVMDDLLLLLDDLLGPVRHDHVIHPLKCRAGDLRALGHDIQVVLKTPLPIQPLKITQILALRDQGDDALSLRHRMASSRGKIWSEKDAPNAERLPRRDLPEGERPASTKKSSKRCAHAICSVPQA